jgi:type I restriction enzyme, S subunit
MTNIATLITDTLPIWTSATQRKSGAGRGGGSKRISLYGIEQLRALILDLAVRGKLVPQDAEDEPASELLKRLGLKSKPSPELPTGWAETTLAQLGTFSGGITPSKSTKRFWGKGVPWVSPKDMGDLEVIAGSVDEITQAALEETSLQIVPIGALLMVARSGILRRKFPLATTAVQCTINQDMKAFIPRPEVSARYIQVMLMGFQPRVLTVLVKRGMTVESLIFNDFIKAVWPIPPLAEQRRIVTKVDELMALCDALDRESADAMAAHQALVETLLATLVNSADAADLGTNWARLDSHFDTLFATENSIEALKQVILDLAVRGKLVDQDVGDEAASELLKQTAKGKAALIRQGFAKRDKALPRVDHSSAPFALPSGWTWARFPELGIFERGKSKHRPRNDPKLFSPGIYPLIQTGEVARATGLITEVHSLYSELGLAQSKLWKSGTLCITIAANIADAAIMGFDACFPDSVVGFVPVKPINDPRYFLYFIRTAKADLLRFAPSTAQKNINLGILETLLIPLPPLAEQHRIVAKVDALMALCDQLKTRLADAAQTQRHLADAIVERAAA